LLTLLPSSLLAAAPWVDRTADGRDLGDRLHGPIRRVDALALGRHAGEVALESGRGADDQIAGGSRAQVGEGVRHPARREGDLSRIHSNEVVPKLEGQLPLEDVEGLVEVVVVERRPAEVGRGHALDHRDLGVCLLASQEDAWPGP
jgi:hypothetical protein